jgi:hypothetical protein
MAPPSSLQLQSGELAKIAAELDALSEVIEEAVVSEHNAGQLQQQVLASHSTSNPMPLTQMQSKPASRVITNDTVPWSIIGGPAGAVMGSKPLRFIHITKNGGTTIEDLGAKEAGLEWGRFMKKEYGWWHGYFPDHDARFKAKYEWFTVVRDPYERMVSEFYCKWGGAGKAARKFSAEDMSGFVLNRVMHQAELQEGIPKQQRHYTSRDWNFSGIVGKYAGINGDHKDKDYGDHYSPQYKYLDPDTPIHVLRFENLEEQFNTLMELYQVRETNE